MSVILDALRKLDREKSPRRKVPANIAVEILKSDSTRPRNGKRIPLYIVVVGVAAVAVAAVTYGVMSGFKSMPKSSPPATKTATAASQQVAPIPREAKVPSKVSLPAAANPPVAGKQVPASLEHRPARAPVHDAEEEVSRVPARVQSPAERKSHADVKIPTEKKEPADVKIPVESKIPSAPVVDKKQTQDVIAPKEADTNPKKTPEPAPSVSAANPASLKVSAIVWYEDPSRRFAMINGVMAREGSSVEGVKVVEINPTSVRLLHNGEYFEISMSK